MNHISINVRCFHRWLAPTLRALKNKKDRLPVRKPDPRKSFIEWNYDAELYAFGNRLGENFNRDVLRQALTEKCYLEKEEKTQKEVGMEPELKLSSNSQLVEKGHAFMEQYILRYLTSSLPDLPNRYILVLKDYLMSDEILAHVSKHVGIDDILLIADDVPKTDNLCRGLKAVVRAVENDQRAERLVRDLVISQLCGFDLTKLILPEKPVEQLDDHFDKTNRSKPEYRLIAESGVNTLLPVYHVGVYCDRQYIGRGFGESVTIAKDMAACHVLWRLWGISRRKPFIMDFESPKPFIPSQIDATSHPNS